MPQNAWSNKRERQYEHIKDSAKKRGASTKRAKEIAARTVNKERARTGEARESSRSSRTDISSGRRGGLRGSGRVERSGPHQGAAVQRSQAHEHPGPVEDEQGAAPARRRSAEVVR